MTASGASASAGDREPIVGQTSEDAGQRGLCSFQRLIVVKAHIVGRHALRVGVEHVAVISGMPGSCHLLLTSHHVLKRDAAVIVGTGTQPLSAASDCCRTRVVRLPIEIEKVDEERSTSVSRLPRKKSLSRIAAAARR